MVEKAERTGGIPSLDEVGEEELVAELARRRARKGHKTIGDIEDAMEVASAADVRQALSIYLEDQSSQQRPMAPCPKCGRPSPMRSANRKRTIRSMSGEQTLTRNYHYCSSCTHGFYPLDAELGLCEHGELTPKMRARVMDFGVSSPYGEAAERWSVHYRVPVSEHMIRATVDRVAECWAGKAQAEWQSELRKGPISPSQLLVVQTDGSMLPMRGPEPWKEAKVGVVYREEQHVAANDNVGHRRGQLSEARYAASIGSDEFQTQMRVALRLERAHEALRIAWVGDGAACNWTLAKKICPKAIQILDWMHAVEHAADCAKTLFGADDPCVPLWTHRIEQLLAEGDVRTLISELSECWLSTRRRAPNRVAIDNLLRYYKNNRYRMDYRRFRELGLPIGSGTVESAHRHVLQGRMKLAGQHWDIAHAKRMVRLRAAYKTAGPQQFALCVARAA